MFGDSIPLFILLIFPLKTNEQFLILYCVYEFALLFCKFYIELSIPLVILRRTICEVQTSLAKLHPVSNLPKSLLSNSPFKPTLSRY